MNYLEFIDKKSEFKKMNGIEIDINDLNPVLFDYQKAIVKKALKKKRFCLFEACGMGKTLQQLELSHQVATFTNKPVLIVAPLGVTAQTAYEEAPLLGYEANVIIDIDVIDDSFEHGLFREVGTSATSFHKEKNRTADIRAKNCAEIAKRDS